MPKYIILLFSFPFCSIFAESSVWRISKGSHSFYIGGTCGALRSSDYPLPPEFELAYSLSDTIVFEMDPSVTNDPDFTFRLLKTASYQGNRSLGTVLSRENFNALKEKCEQNEFSIEVLKKTKPSMVIMLLTLKELAKIDVTKKGVDYHFHKRALRDRKSVLALETTEFQINLIASIDEGMENEIIAYGLSDIDDLQNNFNNLIRLWREGDLEAVQNQIVKKIRKHPKLYKKLLSDRNREWIKYFEAFTYTEETEFVLVGLAHLAGRGGLISRLQKGGYIIEQIGVPTF